MIYFFKKNARIIPFLIVFSMVGISIYYQYYRHSRMTAKAVGQIYGYNTDADAREYYEYRYYYNGKKYFNEELGTLPKPKDSLLLRCFEVLLDPEKPERSSLNFNKGIDCNEYEDTKKINSIEVFP